MFIAAMAAFVSSLALLVALGFVALVISEGLTQLVIMLDIAIFKDAD